jgi:O-antigen ligase
MSTTSIWSENWFPRRQSIVTHGRKSRAVLMVAISAFVLIALVDPTDQITHLKMPLFAAVVGVWLIRVLSQRVVAGAPELWTGVLFFALVIPTYATFVGLAGTSLPVAGPTFATVKSFMIIVLLPIVVTERASLVRIVARYSVVVALLTLAMVVISIVAPIVFDMIYAFTLEKQNALVRPTDLFGIGMGSFYYKTVAVLVFPIVYHLEQLASGAKKIRQVLMLLIYSAAIFFSGSRASILAVALVFGYFLAIVLKRRLGVWSAPVLMFIAVLGLSLAAIVFGGFFDAKETSNAAKLGHVHSYMEEFEAHPRFLLFGQGADTEFYTEGFQRKTNLTEVTYLELVRVFGLPVTVVLLAGFFYPLIPLSKAAVKGGNCVGIAYGVYLFEAASNPLLIGSTGLLVVVSVWAFVLSNHFQPERTHLTFELGRA